MRSLTSGGALSTRLCRTRLRHGARLYQHPALLSSAPQPQVPPGVGVCQPCGLARASFIQSERRRHRAAGQRRTSSALVWAAPPHLTRPTISGGRRGAGRSSTGGAPSACQSTGGHGTPRQHSGRLLPSALAPPAVSRATALPRLAAADEATPPGRGLTPETGGRRPRGTAPAGVRSQAPSAVAGTVRAELWRSSLESASFRFAFSAAGGWGHGTQRAPSDPSAAASDA